LGAIHTDCTFHDVTDDLEQIGQSDPEKYEIVKALLHNDDRVRGFNGRNLTEHLIFGISKTLGTVFKKVYCSLWCILLIFLSSGKSMALPIIFKAKNF
jgi:hypothetical protein